MGKYAVVVTGASGSVYGLRAIEQLVLAGQEVTCVFTDAGRAVTAHELGFELPREGTDEALRGFLKVAPGASLRVADCDDLFDPLASGSHRLDGVLVVPAAMGYCGTLASGAGRNLAERVADVALKERWPLVVVPREAPLSLIHLRTLVTLAEAGAIVVPASPGFYHRPSSIDEVVNQLVGKVLDVVGIEHELFERWGAE